MTQGVVVSEEVATALSEGTAVVSLESTIFSNLGLPAPANTEVHRLCTAAVRSAGAIPALTAVLDGVGRVGIGEDELDRVLSCSTKVAGRDLPVAIGLGLESGVTTVSASLALSAITGIRVFATGGIGGVHRGSDLTGDISADLEALARFRVACFSAGAKAFLDLSRTLEYLETVGVPVVGYRTDDFPAFYTRSSGLGVPHRVDKPAEAAAIIESFTEVGHTGGVLFVVPIPEADELDAEPSKRLSMWRSPMPQPPRYPGPTSLPSSLLAYSPPPMADRSLPTWLWPRTTPKWPPRLLWLSARRHRL